MTKRMEKGICVKKLDQDDINCDTCQKSKGYQKCIFKKKNIDDIIDEAYKLKSILWDRFNFMLTQVAGSPLDLARG